jgi:hypothetical protein
MSKYNLYKQLPVVCTIPLRFLIVSSWCIDQWFYAENENGAKGID